MEKLSLKKRASIAMLLSLGFTACGGGESVPTNNETPTTLKQDLGAKVKIDYEYTEDGKRVEIQDFVEGADYKGFFRKIFAECDGRFIIERTVSYNDMPSTQVRTLAEEECADGRLTPEDFAIQAPESVLPEN